MIPYEQLCAALDRYNGVASEPEPALEAVTTAEVVEEMVEAVDPVMEEAPVMTEAPAAEEGFLPGPTPGPDELDAAVGGAFPMEPTPPPFEEPPMEEVVLSSAGEDAAATSGFIGGEATPAPALPDEGSIQVEPGLQDHRMDNTDEVSLDDMELVGEDSDPQK